MTPNWEKRYCKKSPNILGIPSTKEILEISALLPPCVPSGKKNLCDEAGIFNKRIAQDLLEQGFKRGFFSISQTNNWPRNVWALSEQNIPLEARLDRESGTYHGFPMSENDPLSAEILEKWGRQE